VVRGRVMGMAHASCGAMRPIETCRLKPQCCPKTLLPAGSRGICTKTPATWPVRTRRLRNTWRAVPGERKSRCCSHIPKREVFKYLAAHVLAFEVPV
jgi:hypothetical protein